MALRVFRRVRDRVPHAVLVMAGQDKGFQAQTMELARDLELDDAVTFPGFLNMEAKLREGSVADIFLNTNRVDNMPVSVVEACAMGLAVVATKVGGIPDLLTDGDNALLVPDNDDERMADAVLRLLNDPDLGWAAFGQRPASRGAVGVGSAGAPVAARVCSTHANGRGLPRGCRLMCGICGIVCTDYEQLPDARLLEAMRDTMVHRGPDDAGDYLGSGVAFGSRRLAILDLSPRGHMPMTTAERRYWITYNGEIYNFQELRAELEARGCSFQSGSDTEVLLRMYERYGAGMLPRLNGMFALAIWDERGRSLFLARDRMGVKPLYYATQPGALHFASEQKALFASGIEAAFDQTTWEELMCFRYVGGERTPFVGVKRLLPGHFLTWRNGDIRIQRWWSLRERALERRAVEVRPREWFQETFDSAVDLRRISDVPLGVLLSGGLDSGSVAAALALRTRWSVELHGSVSGT